MLVEQLYIQQDNKAKALVDLIKLAAKMNCEIKGPLNG